MTLGDLGDTLGAGRVTLGSLGSPWHHFGSLEGHFLKNKRASRSIANTGCFGPLWAKLLSVGVALKGRRIELLDWTESFIS